MHVALEALAAVETVTVSRAAVDVANVERGYLWEITFTHVENALLQGSGGMPMLETNASLMQGLYGSLEVTRKIVGTHPLRFRLPNMAAGTPVFCRVAASNVAGFGPYSRVAVGKPTAQPGAVSSPVMSVDSATSLAVSWALPQDVGGISVDMFVVESWNRQPQLEVQTITTSAGPGVQEVQRITTSSSSASAVCTPSP